MLMMYSLERTRMKVCCRRRGAREGWREVGAAAAHAIEAVERRDKVEVRAHREVK